jgi:ABC-2 type transport system permease protein
MPLWARILGNIIPATHFIRISKGIMLKGSNFSETIHHFWPLLAFLCFAIYLGITRYKKTLD